MAEDKKKTPSPGGHEAHKGEASKEKGKTGNLQHANGVLLSTGGGTPIDPGEKWTDEHRVLQPRDKGTGKFTYNSEAHWGLKYKQRNKANTVPPSARELVLAAGIDKAGGLKAGSVIVWNGKTQIILRDMSVDELYDYFKKYDEESGDYYKGRSLLEKGDKKDNRKLTSSMAAKQGRHSKAEKEAIEATKDTWNKGDFGVVGHYDMSKMSNKTAEAMKAKFAEAAQGFDPHGWSIPESTDGKIAIAKLPENNVPVTGSHPSSPEPMDNHNPTGPGNPPTPPGGGKGSGGPHTPPPPPGGAVPNATGPQKEKSAPATDKGKETTSKPKRMSSSGGLVKDGKIVDKSKIDYSNPVHKKYFDDVAADMKRNPKKYHMTPEMANAMNGAIVANGAKKGLFDKMKMKWEE